MNDVKLDTDELKKAHEIFAESTVGSQRVAHGRAFAEGYDDATKLTDVLTQLDRASVMILRKEIACKHPDGNNGSLAQPDSLSGVQKHPDGTK